MQARLLQLVWQVAGLAFLIHAGSPQSKKGDGRHEKKLDAIPLAGEPKGGSATIRDIGRRYLRG